MLLENYIYKMYDKVLYEGNECVVVKYHNDESYIIVESDNLGWQRDCHIPEDYVSRISNRFHYVHRKNLTKIEEKKENNITITPPVTGNNVSEGENTIGMYDWTMERSGYSQSSGSEVDYKSYYKEIRDDHIKEHHGETEKEKSNNPFTNLFTS